MAFVRLELLPSLSALEALLATLRLVFLHVAMIDTSFHRRRSELAERRGGNTLSVGNVCA